MSWTYARAGIDVKKVKKVQNEIGKIIVKTYKLRNNKFGTVLSRFGHYASLIDIGNGRALALHTDGCGTKVLFAQMEKKFDTIGIDCVAMCVNDLICLGAEPVALLDYLAIEKSNDEVINEIIRGLAEGAQEAKVTIIGGETAIMPDVIKGAIPGLGFDLAAMGIGVVDTDKVIDGSKIENGDLIIGLESSGLHSNGFTLARKVLLEEAALDLHDKPDGFDHTLGEELLIPTKIYVKEILSIIAKSEVHGIAHITGGAFSKLKRFENYAKVGFSLEGMPEPKPIFSLIKRAGNISDEEMYRTFNMGVGLCLIVPKESADDVISTCNKFGTRSFPIGKITSECGVKIKSKRVFDI